MKTINSSTRTLTQHENGEKTKKRKPLSKKLSQTLSKPGTASQSALTSIKLDGNAKRRDGPFIMRPSSTTRKRESRFGRIPQFFQRLFITTMIIFISCFSLGGLILIIQQMKQAGPFPPPNFKGLMDLQEQVLDLQDEVINLQGNNIDVLDLGNIMERDVLAVQEIAIAVGYSTLPSKENLVNALQAFTGHTRTVIRGLENLNRAMGSSSRSMFNANDFLGWSLERLSNERSTERDKTILEHIWNTALVPFNWPKSPTDARVRYLFLKQAAFSHDVVQAQVKQCESFILNLQKLDDRAWDVYSLKTENLRGDMKKKVISQKSWPWSFALRKDGLAIIDLTKQTEALHDLLLIKEKLERGISTVSERLRFIRGKLGDLSTEFSKPVLHSSKVQKVSIQEQQDIVKRLADIVQVAKERRQKQWEERSKKLRDVLGRHKFSARGKISS